MLQIFVKPQQLLLFATQVGNPHMRRPRSGDHFTGRGRSERRVKGKGVSKELGMLVPEPQVGLVHNVGPEDVSVYLWV
jgi:hypothetical protein